MKWRITPSIYTIHSCHLRVRLAEQSGRDAWLLGKRSESCEITLGNHVCHVRSLYAMDSQMPDFTFGYTEDSRPYNWNRWLKSEHVDCISSSLYCRSWYGFLDQPSSFDIISISLTMSNTYNVYPVKRFITTQQVRCVGPAQWRTSNWRKGLSYPGILSSSFRTTFLPQG